MNQKKIKSTLIFVMLILTTLAFAPQAQATTYHHIWGKLYINGDIAEPGIQINLDVSKDPDNKYPTVITTREIAENGCNLFAGFEDSKYFGAIVSFNMVYRSQIYTVPLNKRGEEVEQYFIDMYYINIPPNTPTNPNPANGATGIATNNDLSWSCTDPDGDPLTYDVYFGTTNPPAFKITQTGTTYDTGTMAEGTTYYWKIVAKDPYGLSTAGPVWSFTTKTSGGGGVPPGGPGGGGGGTTGTPPIADANGPYTGFVGEEITFDGTGSTGTLPLQFDWKFFDEDTWHINIGPTPTYTYTEAGTYMVTLRVSNDFGSSTDTADVTILTGNNPPTKPTLTEYTTTGNKNVEYIYTAVSTDLDNDTITYTFDWGDETNTTTDFLPNATAADVTHNWTAAGKYTMWVQAMDYYNATSEKTYLTILIDAINAGDIGYVTDDNGDGTYDTYHSNDDSVETITEKQTDGTYLIDSDDDSNPNYILDPETGELTTYEPSSGEPAQDNTIWYALLIGMIITILVILLIFMATKKKKGKEK